MHRTTLGCQKMRALWDDLPQTKDVMSSAKATNLISFPSTVIPLIWPLFRIDIASNSSTMIKSEGDSRRVASYTHIRTCVLEVT